LIYYRRDNEQSHVGVILRRITTQYYADKLLVKVATVKHVFREALISFLPQKYIRI